MNDESTIMDYSMIDEFISRSLQDFNKKVFGNYDDKTGYFEERSTEEELDTDDVAEDEFQDEERPSDEMSDEDAYNLVFAEDEAPYYNPNNQGSPYSPDEVSEQYTPAAGSVQFKPGVSSEGLSFRANSIVNELSSVAGEFVVTSGKRSSSENAKVKGVKGSFHLTGDAVDIRPNANIDMFLSSEEGRQFMRERGYEIVDERTKKGSAHWHLEPAKKQAGGKVPVASSKQSQYTGLNNQAFDELYMPLEGTNMIRGLDSYEPVQVQDQNGNSAVLVGPEDTIYMTGGVYEQRLPKKYKTR
jgi:hypothetical protein